MIKVVLVEHDKSVRESIELIFRTDKEIHLFGVFDNAKPAIEFIQKNKPDIVVMDIELTKPSGLEATRTIMETTPVPIIIASSISLLNTFNTFEAGAVAVVERPTSGNAKNYTKVSERLIRTVKLMSEIKVVKRIPPGRYNKKPDAIINNNSILSSDQIKIIAIGASTGGPVVIEKILAGLPNNFPIPIVIVQHIASGFTEGFVNWLNEKSSIPVEIASSNKNIEKGHCYIAPEGFHLKVTKNGRLHLSDDLPVNNLKPSISALFNSVAEIYGKEAVGIILTGMGKDGSLEFKEISDKGGITIAQDKESSLIFGMPGEAIKLGGAKYIFSTNQIIQYLKKIK